MRAKVKAAPSTPETTRFAAAPRRGLSRAVALCGGPRRRRRRGRKWRRGATLVEFAVVAPLLFLFIVGVFEFGRMMMVQQILTNGAREGARRAILEQSTASQVQQTVQSYLSGSSVSGVTVTVTPDPLTLAGFGDPVTVTCSVPYDQVTWFPGPWLLGGTDLRGRSTMGAERLE